MDVSIIFATHNREDIIAEVLKQWHRVKENTKYSFEIICSDDESTDRTIEIIEQDTVLPIVLIKNKKGGAGQARNQALKIAKGEIIIFTGDDILPECDFVNRHYENYCKYGKYVATLGRIEWSKDINVGYLMHHITEVGCEQFGFIALPPYQFINFRHFYTSNISVSKFLLDMVGEHFSEKFVKYGFEDIELGYRLQNIGMKIFYDPDIVARHHHIYDSVDKFCVRQKNAGEELIVFSEIHTDLEDKCTCDVENFRLCWEKYKSKRKKGICVKGIIVKKVVIAADFFCKIMEKAISLKPINIFKSICSMLYAGLFQFWFLFGCLEGIEKEARESSKYEFVYRYMKCGFAQLYWDIGFGITEQDSRKWMIWDGTEVKLMKRLPDRVRSIRFTPKKQKCIAKINEMYFEDYDGNKIPAEISWHNACCVKEKEYDFSNTIDPQILIEKIEANYKNFFVVMEVKNIKLRENNLIKRLYRTAIMWAGRCRSESQSELNVYEYGQTRKICIRILGHGDNENISIIERYKQAVSVLGNDCIVLSSKEKCRGYTEYLYEPGQYGLNGRQMLQVAYTLLHYPYDYIVVSENYRELPEISCLYGEENIVYSSMLISKELNYGETAVGKVLRLPCRTGKEIVKQIGEIVPITHWNEQGIIYKIKSEMPKYRYDRHEYSLCREKPIIFVIPIFFAIGGVERNTVEVMRALHDKYDFCLITLEKHNFEQGSLHYQLNDINCDIYDLAEISDESNYLKILSDLKSIYRPNIVWLCNNSPWFESHIGQIRNIFSEVPMIAQDVYDTKEGWIEYYKYPEVRQFDRYIAITEIIKDEFLNKYKIEKEKIDVIYPVVDDASIRRIRDSKESYEEICRKYSLDENKLHFATVGRIVKQKNPIRYLKMIQELGKIDEIEFLMVGEGAMDEEVDQYILQNNMKKNIHRIPYITDAPRLIKILDGLIIMSDYEGMPIVSIEAMSLGVPVFSTNVGDLKHFLEKTRGGAIIDQEESDVEAFEKFRRNLEYYKKNANQHKESILQFFSVNSLAQKYYDCFEKAAGTYKNTEI